MNIVRYIGRESTVRRENVERYRVRNQCRKEEQKKRERIMSETRAGN